jgi:DNA (cytosine-5)-methyltransferase 1
MTPGELAAHERVQLVNAADYGVPQVRYRVVLVGFRQDLAVDWAFPPVQSGRGVRRGRDLALTR